MLTNLTATWALAGALAAQAAAGRPGENLARGKACRLRPTPNYRHCTDAADRTQLTDGVYTKGYFWTQKTTVGWTNAAAPTITIDLGAAEPIAGVSVNMAAGVAGVTWPMAVFLFVSDDGKAHRFVGDLVELAAADRRAPPKAGYAVHRFRTARLATCGRFVTVAVVPSGPYVFCDEIEVHRGGDELLARPPGGQAVSDIGQFLRRMQVTWGVRRRLRADAAAVRKQVRAAALPPAESRRAAAELDDVVRRIASLKVPATESFRAVLPLNELHRRIFAVQAAAWRAGGAGRVVAWRKNRWDMLSPTEPPLQTPAAIDLALMRNEFRSAAVNLSNASAETARLRLFFAGLPGGATPDYLTMHDVPFTDTKSGVPVAAALPAARRDGEAWTVEVPPGMTRQVWLTVRSKGLDAGEHRGHLLARPGSIRIPVRLKVYPLTFPRRPSLHLCGWDYTDCDAYNVTPANREAFLRALREHYVDSPWAQSGTMPPGRYDKTGTVTAPPDDARFRTWLARWPDARNYLVFAAVSERFAGFPLGTGEFRKAVAAWITWWAARAKALGLRDGQLGLLLVDEPHRGEQDRIIIEYAKVIRAAAPKVVIWEDPTWREPWKATGELFDVCDVLCPNLPMWIAGGRRFADFYAARRRAGRELWLYSCSGPGRLLDPYAYHRMQMWFCWKHGAKGAGYWAFGDSSGASSWNEYLSVRGAYTPLFLDDATVTAGKHMEAIREGVQDYEVLRMLRDRIAELALARPGDARLAAARKLLSGAADRVTACMTDAGQIHWARPKDRAVADRVRVEVLDMLVRLAGPGRP